MINIRIDKKLKEKCNVHIVSIEAKVKVGNSDDRLIDVINKTCKKIESNIKQEDILKLKNIDSSRKAYKSLGKDPSRYRLSSESLVKRVVKGMGLYYVNNIVEINNLVSLESNYSVGTYDLDKIKGEIVFSVGEEGERYDGIGRGSINLENMPVFKDEEGYFGSTTSDSTKAMITEDTKHILMNIIAFENDEKLSDYLEFASKLIKEHANGVILDTKIIF
ncbi:B3/B4 domain-containing protein [Romboutsia sp.]|uniref:B3/B4 domain-containing protein n=1 Tax=Romboutsia sp. TaxID=1965302 RepID=UPI003F371870